MPSDNQGPPWWPRNHLEAVNVVLTLDGEHHAVCVWSDDCSRYQPHAKESDATRELDEHRDWIKANADVEADERFARERDAKDVKRRDAWLEEMKASGHLVVERVG